MKLESIFFGSLGTNDLCPRQQSEMQKLWLSSIKNELMFGLQLLKPGRNVPTRGWFFQIRSGDKCVWNAGGSLGSWRWASEKRRSPSLSIGSCRPPAVSVAQGSVFNTVSPSALLLWKLFFQFEGFKPTSTRCQLQPQSCKLDWKASASLSVEEELCSWVHCLEWVVVSALLHYSCVLHSSHWIKGGRAGNGTEQRKSCKQAFY